MNQIELGLLRFQLDRENQITNLFKKESTKDTKNSIFGKKTDEKEKL